MDEESHKCHLGDCHLIAEQNRNLFMVPNTLGFPTNGTDGLISGTDLFPRGKEASIGFLRTETDPDPFDIHIPDIPEDVPFNQGIKCLGCNQSFQAASLPIQLSKVETGDQQGEDGSVSPVQISSITKTVFTADVISASKTETVPSAASEHEAGLKSSICIKSNQKTHSSPHEEITREDSIITQSSHPISCQRKLVGCVEYYRHCIMECPKYQKVNQVKSCLHCLKLFLNGDDFKDHKSSCPSVEEEEEKPFTLAQGIKCVHCGLSHDDLEAHYENNHPGIQLYPCLTCDKVYQRKRCLTRHEVQWHKLVTCGSLRKEDFDPPKGLRRSSKGDSNVIVLDSNSTSRTSGLVKKACPESIGQSMLMSTPLKKCNKSNGAKSKRKKSQREEGMDWSSPIVSLSPIKEGNSSRGKGVKNEPVQIPRCRNPSSQSINRFRNPSGQSINRFRNPSSQSSRRNPSSQSVNLRTRNLSGQVTPLKNFQGYIGLSPSSALSDSSLNQSDFPCDICPIRFVKSVHLKHHKSSVHESKRMSCIKCSKTFKSINSYMNHHHFLDDERICYLGFRSSPSEGGFSQVSVLGSSYEDYFTKSNNCTICGKWFGKSKNQSDHFLSVHVGTLFRCPYCPLSFRYVPSIESHLRKSHGCKDTISNPTPYFVVFKDSN